MNDPHEVSDEALSRRLQSELPRHRAPDHLRATIRPPRARRRPAWMAPTLAALATAALVLLFLLPVPSSNRADPLQRLARAVVAEHSRALMWGARSSTIMPTGPPGSHRSRASPWPACSRATTPSGS